MTKTVNLLFELTSEDETYIYEKIRKERKNANLGSDNNLIGFLKSIDGDTFMALASREDIKHSPTESAYSFIKRIYEQDRHNNPNNTSRTYFLALDNKCIEKGDIVEFGSYPQRGESYASIKWNVLDIKDGKALLLSNRIIECKRYNTIERSDTWEDCSLRKWLNNDFLSTAFSEEERSKIICVHNENPANSRNESTGGNATDDYIFCLSIDEAGRLTEKERVAAVTKHAVGSWYNKVPYNNGLWLLRSSSDGKNHVAVVSNYGDIQSYGINVCSDIGVRPALWMRL